MNERDIPGLAGRPPIQNSDGSTSSELSITVEVADLNGGRPTNIPTIWNGRKVPDDEAIRMAVSSGFQFPSFTTIDEAVADAQATSGTGKLSGSLNSSEIEQIVQMILSGLHQIKR